MNDIDWYNGLEEMDKRTKEYKEEFKEYCKKYIEVKNE